MLHSSCLRKYVLPCYLTEAPVTLSTRSIVGHAKYHDWVEQGCDWRQRQIWSIAGAMISGVRLSNRPRFVGLEMYNTTGDLRR